MNTGKTLLLIGRQFGQSAEWNSATELYWDCGAHANSMLTFIRHDRESGSHVLAVLNLTPNPLTGYRIGLPKPGRWREMHNSDAATYAGSNQGNPLGVTAEDYAVQNQHYSAMFTLPPLSVSVFKGE